MDRDRFERGYSHMRSEDRATGEVDPKLPADYFDGILFSSYNTRTRSVLLDVSGCLAIVRVRKVCRGHGRRQQR